MAGSRRQSGRPVRDRARRRGSAFRTDLAAARTPADRVMAAVQYLRGALHRANRRDAEAAASEVVRVAADHAERILAGGDQR